MKKVKEWEEAVPGTAGTSEGPALSARWIMRKPLKSFDQDSGKFRFVLFVKSS